MEVQAIVGSSRLSVVSAEEQEEADEQLRIGVIASPRSGNTWLRGLLAATYGLEEVAALTPEDINWQNLPPRLVLQIHWHAVEPFLSLLREHGFRVVSPARHPLDLFISTLNYQQYVDETVRWSNQDGQGDRSLRGATPRSAAFLDFICSLMGENVLATSREWWQVPGTICVRYEDLVRDTLSTLRGIVEALDVEVRRPIEQVVSSYEIDRLRIEYDVWHYHYWQGKPGHWKRLLPGCEAFRIAEFHAEAFRAMGYVCDPDPDLDATQADLNWFSLQFDSMRQHLELERKKHAKTRTALEAESAHLALERERLVEVKSHAATALEALVHLRGRHRAMRRELAATRKELDAALAQIRESEGLTPLSISAARGVSKPSREQSWFSATVKRLMPQARKTA